MCSVVRGRRSTPPPRPPAPAPPPEQSRAEINMLLCRMVIAWEGRLYSAVAKNCCSFCDELCKALGVGARPSHDRIATPPPSLLSPNG